MLLLSANEIRQFTECARKRYYSSRSLCALRALKPNYNLVLGNAVHDMLQYYYERGRTKQQLIDEGREPFELQEEVIEILIEGDVLTTFNCIHELYQERLSVDLAKYKVRHCEYQFEMEDWPIEGVKYHGLIDMIVQEKESGLIYFVEHKTCRTFRPEIYNRFDIQLHIYSAFAKHYCDKRGLEYGGIILNEIKKAKTPRGYAEHRMTYLYDEEEDMQFFNWLKGKTLQLVSSSNNHGPCNNYMTCSMCEYAEACLTYGYKLPNREDILNELKDESGEPLYQYNPREDKTEEKE